MTRPFLKPDWMLTTNTGERFEPRLFRLLHAIQETGRLTAATNRLGVSYRHAWDILGKWQSILGAPLVVMERGKGARLTALGERFVWAEQRISASLFPQLENVAFELNAAVGKARPTTTPTLRIHASHGYAVEKLPELCRRAGSAEIELRYMGSVEALASLARGQCDLAGFHVPVGDLAPAVGTPYLGWLRAGHQKIIRLVTRTQGLIVARGNPLRIRTLADLRKKGVRLVNRQPGSGTRLLFDALLHTAGIDKGRITGYDTVEFTHGAVGAFIATGAANVGLGVEPAARKFNLDFVPLVTEQYMLACSSKLVTKPIGKDLIDLIGGTAFAKAMESVPGYALDCPGTLVSVAEVFPWAARSIKK